MKFNRRTLLAPVLIFAGTFASANPPSDVETVADILHPNIHDKVGDGSNANPNGVNDNGGEIHGIRNVPGQSGADPGSGAPGFADQLDTVHGGIAHVNHNTKKGDARFTPPGLSAHAPRWGNRDDYDYD